MADGGVLTDRASLARAFYRLTATSSANPALIEHDGANTLEALYSYLQYGMWDAQEFMLDNGMSDRWVAQSSALTPFLGTDAANAGRYIALPTDFIRLASGLDQSALRTPDGTPWGRLVEFKDRLRVGGGCYWLQGEFLWISRGSSPPTTMIMDYHQRHATLADASTVDFPTALRALPVAYAALRAKTDAWLPGDAEMEAKIDKNLLNLQREARRRARRTRDPKKIGMNNTGASHHWR